MMKKITLIMLALVSLSLSAQTYYSEDFEAETLDSEPSTFTVLNEDNCSVNTPCAVGCETPSAPLPLCESRPFNALFQKLRL